MVREKRKSYFDLLSPYMVCFLLCSPFQFLYTVTETVKTLQNIQNSATRNDIGCKKWVSKDHLHAEMQFLRTGQSRGPRCTHPSISFVSQPKGPLLTNQTLQSCFVLLVSHNLTNNTINTIKKLKSYPTKQYRKQSETNLLWVQLYRYR